MGVYPARLSISSAASYRCCCFLFVQALLCADLLASWCLVLDVYGYDYCPIALRHNLKHNAHVSTPLSMRCGMHMQDMQALLSANTNSAAQLPREIRGVTVGGRVARLSLCQELTSDNVDNKLYS